jgi:translocation and assembly module TamA
LFIKESAIRVRVLRRAPRDVPSQPPGWAGAPARRGLALAALALLLALPAHAASDKVKVAVRVNGVEDDLKRNVQAALSIAQKRTDREADVRDRHADAEKEIREALQPYGYYAPVVTSELERKGETFHATYTIDPGPPLEVDTSRVEVTGAGADDPEFRRLVARFPLRRGAVLLHREYENAKKDFIKAAMRRGYLDGRFTRQEITVDLQRYGARIDLAYATGPQYLFGPVEFRQDVVKPELLRGYVTFEEGEPVDYNELLALEESLGKSPYFSRVEVLPDRSGVLPGNRLPIIVTLTPARPEKYTFGVGYGTDNGPHARAIAELRRINRRGHRGQVEGTLSKVEQTAAAQYAVPWPYPRSDVLTASTGYTARKTVTTEERTGFVGLAWSRLWAGWQTNVSLNARREKWQVASDSALATYLVPEASWSRLRTNDPIDPTDGSRLRFRGSLANEALLSAETFERLDAEAKWMRTFARRHQLILDLQGGYTWMNDFRSLPPSARFFAGGSHSVRGFSYNRLGARDAFGRTIGGRALAVVSLEYVLRIGRGWGIAGFYDTGNAMMSFREKLEAGAGGGLRWLSPVGVIRLDVGVPLTEPKRNPQLHLSIGPGL